ncbi:MAG: LssY C-terminal domain-containing protein [Verrucomicrobia bacterium]|nr:LssY C-terminal domain-containing protein [Verrucomicrobiota bacterium]
MGPTGLRQWVGSWVRLAWRTLAVGLLVYGGLAYLLLPAWWSHYEYHPGLETAPKTAFTREGIPADPLNVALVGTEAEVVRAMLAAGWSPADPTTFRTGLRIAASVLLGRAYPTAPVSDLYLWSHKQDLAFEQLAGTTARRRHHVRFWRSRKLDVAGRHLWLGAATFDSSVGLSHLTGKVTHHIAPDVDAERDKLFADLGRAGQLVQWFQVTGVGPSFSARNGGGDRYYTDGELFVGLIPANNVAQSAPPRKLPNPAVIDLKDKTWSWLKPLLR